MDIMLSKRINKINKRPQPTIWIIVNTIIFYHFCSIHAFIFIHIHRCVDSYFFKR
ncbi:372R [Invertebrate iridescent virus Kaz2018]|uniref:372R n=1 Tax=Invertebrate iridescent virus 6 TaxID=176652 RepID=Q91FF2_IIV6|nr:372R [Invertebrate iridescent virus 6]AAK82232.1 372R [Invertebrate iridescent virus 6]QMS79617.1 hypothetical protein IIV6-T1_365 [Invertebrate iridescent virus 6]QNH08782.1 372R [Invertebrate iridescent virus Kaz2018]